MIETEPVGPERIDDVAAVFNSSAVTRDCWCMWFLVPVKDFHAAGAAGNRSSFEALVEESDTPVGLLAYRDGQPIGWCAVGPRSRYARALRTPTFRGRDEAEDDSVWLVPCFYVHRSARRRGVSRRLLERAVALATEHGAAAIEGFPFAGDKRRPSGDAYIGMEPLFASCGFTVTRRPSATRVVMRRELR